MRDSTPQRTPLSTRERFAILERDSFTCQYCGATPRDDARLHVDHIVPVALGGTNHSSNLITACQECNLGKSALDIGNQTPQHRRMSAFDAVALSGFSIIDSGVLYELVKAMFDTGFMFCPRNPLVKAPPCICVDVHKCLRCMDSDLPNVGDE